MCMIRNINKQLVEIRLDKMSMHEEVSHDVCDGEMRNY